MTAAVSSSPGPAGSAESAPIVRCRDLVHVYGSEGNEVAALRGIDLELGRGEAVALLGPSGSGKTTLLWHLAGLLRPTVGTVEVAGVDLASLTGARVAEFRRTAIGIVLQGPGRNLLPYDTATGNLLFAAGRRSSGRDRRSLRDRARELLDAVGLSAVASRPAGRLSGGEQQRLAVAIALVNSPPLLLADEPTSQLDPRAGESVLELLAWAASQWGTTVLAVTHDPVVAEGLGRTVSIRDGRVGAVGRTGAEHLVVGRDGSVLLPREALVALPPGTPIRPVTHPGGVDLRRLPS